MLSVATYVFVSLEVLLLLLHLPFFRFLTAHKSYCLQMSSVNGLSKKVIFHPYRLQLTCTLLVLDDSIQ